MTKHVLVVEDEHELANMICRFMQKEGYQTTHLDEGTLVVDFVVKHRPGIIILDLKLPGKDGVTICQEIRRFSNIPIIMITAKDSETDRLIGFDVGADDYVCKPLSARELVMRTGVHLRRVNREFDRLEDELKLNVERLQVTFRGNSIELTVSEYELISVLQKEPEKIFSRNFILDNIYKDYRVVSDRAVDSHIRNLRKKMKKLTQQHEFIHSVYGAGYRYVPYQQS